MTSEAKVGLLVGLAFIVLFGVVISNSAEKNRQVSLAPLTVPIPTGPVSPNDPVLPVTDKLNHPASKSEIAQANSKSTLAGNLAVADKGPSAGGSRLDQPVQPQDDRLADASKKADASDKQRLIVVPIQRPPLDTDSGLGESLAMNPPRPAPVLPGTESVTPGSPSTPQAPTASAEVQYTVKAGDSWFKIARTQWGEKFAGQWKQIAQANKSVCKDEKSLAPGMVLVIPARPDGKTPGVTVAPDRQLADSSKPRETITFDEKQTSAPMTRFYTVKKGDTVYKIAEKELGNSQLYKAILELNKGTLKKDGSLSIGMRLKLPVIAPATQPASDSEKTARPAKHGGRATT